MELSQIDPKVFSEKHRGLAIGTQLKIGGQKRVWQCAFEEKAYVLKALMAQDQTIRRLRREIEIMHVCESRYLPRFGPLPLQELEMRDGSKVLYFLEEYIDGLPLSSVHKPMPVGHVVALARCISSALEALSVKGYVHRDVKPMNILQKDPSEYVLIDAGIALDHDGEAISDPGFVVGTKYYLSPDQLSLPPKELDFRSDLFSLGVTMFESATDQHPFMNDKTPRGDVIHNILSVESPDPRSFNERVPTPLCAIILRLLQKDRNERYSSFSELQIALDKVEH
jgi:serine/threonine-protein kinase